MAIIGLNNTLPHMTVRTGIRYRETIGELSGAIQLGPYDETRVDDTALKITPRTLETFLGSVVKKFSPNSVYQSIYGSSIVKGEGLKGVEINHAVLAYLMKQLSKSLNSHIWNAVRNDTGTTTVDLFNGFDTIATTEITAGNISTSNKNLYEFPELISRVNAVDLLKEFYWSASDELQGEKSKLFITNDIYHSYIEDYKATTGAIPYNREFQKTVLEGSDTNCELVPLPNKKGSPYIQLTTKGNMLIGTDQQSDLEKIIVEKHEPWRLDFIAALFFGAQYETISPERLFVGKLYVAPPPSQG
jgi:hypothetical protein